MNSDTEDAITDEKEKQILRLIKRIKKDRNRPSYQSILSFANREENKMDMDELKSILDKMIAENIIKNIGVNGKESFIIVEEKTISSDTASTNTQTYSENIGGDITNLENFINTSFFDTLTNMIKGEVKSALKSLSETSELKDEISQELNARTKDNRDEIYLLLKNQITFLQNELMAKDTIIKMLINDHNGVKGCDASRNQNAHNFNNSSFNVAGNSMRTCSVKHTQNHNNTKDEKVGEDICVNRNSSRTRINVNTDIPTNNRYDALAENTNDISVHNDENTNDISVHNDENVAKRVNENTVKRSITILGDSIIKDIKSYEMKRCMKRGEKIYVKTFPGATTDCMKDYVKPSIKHNPDFVISHTGTNDLKSTKSAMEISDEIIKLALDIKTDENEVVVSGILARNDDMNTKVRGKRFFEDKMLEICSSVFK